MTNSEVKLMSNEENDLRNEFLLALRRERVNVRVFFVSGVTMDGMIQSFDDSSIILTPSSLSSLLISQSAVTAVVPNRPEKR
ncbi:MAG: RNA chaperone Hfq [Rickettsiaceae bacterium H1]|nr:RNA chaperone Hfq [Rickettsiaceae bacterium H1]